MKGFLYGQTEYNILASANRLDDYVKMAKDNHFDYLTITDRNMFGAFKFYQACKNNNIKPVIGLEYTFNFGDNGKSIVLLYAKNNNGYRNLINIASKVDIDNIDTLEDIMDYSSDLIFVFVFNESLMEKLIKSHEYKLLNEILETIKNLKGYIGISNTNYTFKEDINNEIVTYTLGYNIPCINIHKCAYLKSSDFDVYDTLRKIDGDYNSDAINDYSFPVNPVNDSIVDSIVNSIELTIYDGKVKLPKFINSNNMPSDEYLKSLCDKGLRRRLSINRVNPNYYPIYFDRLKYELDIINKMGFDDYFLIVWDFIRYSKQNNILVGPGRGSAAASLVAYCLGITEIDPIKYDLLFERFLNPARVTMPDIDTDFPDTKRDQVLEYVSNKYGEKNICNIVTFVRFKLRSSIKDLARLLKFNDERASKLVDMVEKYGYNDVLLEYQNTDPELYRFLLIAKGLEDLPRTTSTHPAGIIMSDKSLFDLIPLSNGLNVKYQSQFEASDLERIGLLKMDFLVIGTLTLIEGMMRDANFSVNDLRNIPLDDPKVYKLLSSGDTLGLFQIESSGFQDVFKKLRPTNFMDIVAAIALFRPGPSDYIPDYINGKHTGNVKYPHPDLEPILKETYGVIVYQEQIMQIARKFAGFSLGEADLLRRAISKKDSSKLDSLESEFISKSISNGYDRETAVNIYNLIYKFANYGFNKPHSVVYALIAYQMAYFKVNYFPVFMANMLNNVISSAKLLYEYIRYAKARGLKIHKPNINISLDRFKITKEGVFIPFNAIKSIGNNVTAKILEARSKPFLSYDDFRNRTPFLTSEQITALIFSGALDTLGKTKKGMCENRSDSDLAFLKHMNLRDEDEYDISYLREMENDYLGFNLEYSIYKDYNILINKYKLNPLNRIRIGDRVNTLASFRNISNKNVKKTNEKMLVGYIENDTISYRFVLFPKTYSGLNMTIEENKLYIINGYLKADNRNEINFIIDNIYEIKE